MARGNPNRTGGLTASEGIASGPAIISSSGKIRANESLFERARSYRDQIPNDAEIEYARDWYNQSKEAFEIMKDAYAEGKKDVDVFGSSELVNHKKLSEYEDAMDAKKKDYEDKVATARSIKDTLATETERAFLKLRNTALPAIEAFEKAGENEKAQNLIKSFNEEADKHIAEIYGRPNNFADAVTKSVKEVGGAKLQPEGQGRWHFMAGEQDLIYGQTFSYQDKHGKMYVTVVASVDTRSIGDKDGLKFVKNTGDTPWTVWRENSKTEAMKNQNETVWSIL